MLIDKKHQVYNIKKLAFVQRSSCVVKVVKVSLSILASLAFSTPAFSVAPHLCQNELDPSSRFDTIPACDGQTDRQADTGP